MGLFTVGCHYHPSSSHHRDVAVVVPPWSNFLRLVMMDNVLMKYQGMVQAFERESLGGELYFYGIAE